MTSCAMKNVGLKLGDKITVKVNDVSKGNTAQRYCKIVVKVV